jgi:UDP:flavonoid glycosyltransferase YjiC (YdhE family)
VRGCVSHCGWGSVTEAIISKTPLICVPAFIDQPINAKIVIKKSIGVVVYDTVNFEIPDVFDIDLSEERFANGVTAVFENDIYYRSIERLYKMSTLHNATRNICNIVIESLEFGNGHLLNQQLENATIKTGVPLSQILKPEYLPPDAQ